FLCRPNLEATAELRNSLAHALNADAHFDSFKVVMCIGNRPKRADNCAVLCRYWGQLTGTPYSKGIAAQGWRPEEDDMAHTNRVRVILGGLLAGVVINIVEYITNGVVLKQAWGQAMQALGKPGELSAVAIGMFNIWGFLLGIAAVWLYAAIRPRYGLGVNTAIRAGIAAWALAVFLANLSNYPLGLFPPRLLVITTVVALVEIVAATLVGAWIY